MQDLITFEKQSRDVSSLCKTLPGKMQPLSNSLFEGRVHVSAVTFVLYQ